MPLLYTRNGSKLGHFGLEIFIFLQSLNFYTYKHVCVYQKSQNGILVLAGSKIFSLTKLKQL